VSFGIISLVPQRLLQTGLPRNRKLEIRRRSGGSGPPLRTALRNSKLPGMATEFVAGRLEESQPAILSPKLALQLGRMVQPALIEEVCGALWTTGPYRRNGVDDKANVLPRQLRALRRFSTDKRASADRSDQLPDGRIPFGNSAVCEYAVRTQELRTYRFTAGADTHFSSIFPYRFY
jgi:hypothetical protein